MTPINLPHGFPSISAKRRVDLSIARIAGEIKGKINVRRAARRRGRAQVSRRTAERLAGKADWTQYKLRLCYFHTLSPGSHGPVSLAFAPADASLFPGTRSRAPNRFYNPTRGPKCREICAGRPKFTNIPSLPCARVPRLNFALFLVLEDSQTPSEHKRARTRLTPTRTADAATHYCYYTYETHARLIMAAYGLSLIGRV